MIMLRVALGKEGPWGHRGLRENTRSSIYPDLAPSLSHVFLNKKMYSRCRFIYCQVCTTFVGGVIITNIVPKNFNIFSPSAAQRWGRNGQEVIKCTPGWWRQHFKDWGITAELLFDSYWERPALDSFLGILPKIKKKLEERKRNALPPIKHSSCFNHGFWWPRKVFSSPFLSSCKQTARMSCHSKWK